MYCPRYAVRAAALLVLIAAMGEGAAAEDRKVAQALKIIEITIFSLPAINCYRESRYNVTINDALSDKLYSSAIRTVTGDDWLKKIRKAALKGASDYERMVAVIGIDGFCATAVKRFGPQGTVLPGLVIKRRG